MPLYRTFAELGLIEATATPELIADAMAVNSVAMLTLGTAGSTAGWIPLNYPLLIVKKGRGSTHVMFEAQTQGGGGGPLYRGYYNKNATYGNKWTGWAKIATATPPQEYDLSLADGISGTAKYCKTQEGVVLIHGWVQNLAKPEQGKLSIIATLPEGFRPRNNCRFALISSATAPSIGLVRIEISNAGIINLVAWNEVGTLSAGVSVDIGFLGA